MEGKGSPREANWDNNNYNLKDGTGSTTKKVN